MSKIPDTVISASGEKNIIICVYETSSNFSVAVSEKESTFLPSFGTVNGHVKAAYKSNTHVNIEMESSKGTLA